MIRADSVCLDFAGRTIFDSISFSIATHDRIGLFGLNGAGKSTLLKVIAGAQPIDSGSIQIGKNTTVAYLPQEVTLTSEKSVLEETISTFTKLITLQEKIKAAATLLEEQPDNLDAVHVYAELCQQLVTEEPERKRAECERMLVGLGFTQAMLEGTVNQLSVGWKMRIVLAKLLLLKADFYLFDEPTNHLDIVAKEWFLRFLKNSSFGFMLVCHEKRFLNILCSRILEVEYGHATLYAGSYDRYVVQKKEAHERLVSLYNAQQKELDEMKATISRFRASASKAKMAQSMVKKMDKIERITLPPQTKKIHFSFPVKERSGSMVLAVKDLGFSFGKKRIFQHCSFVVERGSKVAIVAPNGVGKTTLINIISGKLGIQEGSIEIGNKVHMTVFDQDQLATLNLKETVLENARAAAGSKSEEAVRTLLGGFLFGTEAVHKKAGVLSGGERNRLGMVRVLLQDSNVLALDEPTNHLDIPSKELLLEALRGYQGTIIFVSHDHDFVNDLASHILELNATKAVLYAGNYDEYLYQKEMVANNPSTPQPQHDNPAKTQAIHHESGDAEQDKAKRKQMRTLEQTMAKVEAQLNTVADSFADLEYGTQEFSDAQRKLKDLQKQLSAVTAEWESYAA